MGKLSKKGLIACGLIFIGITFVAIGITCALILQRVADPAPAPLPHKLASLPLISQSSGFLAVTEVAQLHNQTFLLTSASVGRYGDKESITIWTTGAPFKFLASQMLVDMREKINAVVTPFTPTGERIDGKRTVYQLQGMGQKHFYFQSGKLIVWMAADQQLAEQAINQILEFYP